MTPSEWCLRKWDEAIERGDFKASEDYQHLYNLWKGRGL